MESTPRILKVYSISVRHVTPLGAAGGFSGAMFWRLETPIGPLCLRRWPPDHPSPERLRFIHDVLRHVHQTGVTQVPLPLTTRDGSTFVRDGDCLWELAPWMPGTADFHRYPTPQRLAAAMRLLARFHQATATYANRPRLRQRSPGLGQRLEALDRLLAGDAKQIAAAARQDTVAARKTRAEQLLDAFAQLAPEIRPALSAAVQVPVDLQPCLRDVWHDHVLFTGDQATGLVDFGSLRDECVAADVARLLASLVRGDQAAWKFGLAAYQSCHPLDPVQQDLLMVFRHTTTLLSGMNWLRWIYLEGRVFEAPDRILARIDENLNDLSHLQAPAERTSTPLRANIWEI